MDPAELSRVLKVDKGLGGELAHKLVDFLCESQDVVAWTHVDMVWIYLEIMCHPLNIDPQAKLVHQRRRPLNVDCYMAFQDEVDYLLKIGFIRESLLSLL